MKLKLAMAVSLFAVIPVIAHAQKPRPAANTPKPTVADVQKLVQMISGDKAKVKIYCDIDKLQQQMAQAAQKKDNKALEALGAKVSGLAQQLGPDYIKVMDGLDAVDPNSAEGKKFTVVFDPLDKQCQ